MKSFHTVTLALAVTFFTLLSVSAFAQEVERADADVSITGENVQKEDPVRPKPYDPGESLDTDVPKDIPDIPWNGDLIIAPAPDDWNGQKEDPLRPYPYDPDEFIGIDDRDDIPDIPWNGDLIIAPGPVIGPDPLVNPENDFHSWSTLRLLSYLSAKYFYHVDWTEMVTREDLIYTLENLE